MTVKAAPAVWAGLDHLDAAAALDFVREAEAGGFEAFWTREGFGREPFALLGAIATATTSMRLGTAIANIYARDPMTARMAANTVQDLSGGRFTLGLGVSHPGWVQGVRGHAYLPPAEAMANYLDAVAAADYKGTPPAVPVPVVIAALRGQMLRVAGERADGAIPYMVTPDTLAAARATLDAAAAAAGRKRPRLIAMVPVVPSDDPAVAKAAARKALGAYSGLPAYAKSYLAQGFDEADFATPDGLSDRFLDRVVAHGSRASIVAFLGEMADAGADELAIVPVGENGAPGSLEAVRRLALPW
jgi:probable F420-dependent oxidoreductase